MNKFCIGQQVIDLEDRKIRTVTKLRGNGVIEVDGYREDLEKFYQVKESFLDKTNYLYHHSRYGDAVSMINEAFNYYMLALEDLAECQGESVFIMKARSYCNETLKDCSAKIEQGLAWKRTAEYNCAQWDGLTLDHHFPFLNPENVTDY